MSTAKSAGKAHAKPASVAKGADAKTDAKTAAKPAKTAKAKAKAASKPGC